MQELFLVKISEVIDKVPTVRYPLTVARTGQIQSTTTNKARATKVDGEQINNMSLFAYKRKLPYTMIVED